MTGNSFLRSKDNISAGKSADETETPDSEKSGALLQKTGLAERAIAVLEKQRSGFQDETDIAVSSGASESLHLVLKELNPQQREAVLTTEGPLLVLAGAGTGKTRVLTARIAYIIERKQAYPSQIMAMTFTNKAAAEMKERVKSLLNKEDTPMPWLGTFHALGAKFLRLHAEAAGLYDNFTILDTDDSLRLLKQLIRAENLDDKRWPARVLAQMIDDWKNKGQTPDKISEADSLSFGEGRGRKLYEAYQARLKTANSCDFGDLLLLPIAVLQNNPDILQKYQKKFRYILVDEYQDTNTAQYLWLRLLAQRPKGENVNLCCVGDDDQSIYGWRGAEVENILRFERDFAGAKIIRLECNYRSTAPILAVASHLIAHNKARLGKTLFTEKISGDSAEQAEKVQLHAAWDGGEEARAIGDEIESLQSKGEKLNTIAILVRASFQTREFEERFGVIGLNYRIIGGPRFYERREIRDAVAYLRVAAQPADDLAFERILNVPKRGLGDVCLRLLRETAQAQKIPLLRAAEKLVLSRDIRGNWRTALRNITENFRRWHDLSEKMPQGELAQIILDESGYTEMWQQEKSAEAAGRLEHLKELARSMEEFENLRGFLEHIALVMENESKKTHDAVSIMTLHAAKGLEFDTVFLPGWEEGLFPHQRSLDEGGGKGLEEERRLAYVGLTRARKREYIWFSQNRRIHGLWQNTMPSRFLSELPEDSVEIAPIESSFGGYSHAYQTARFTDSDSFADFNDGGDDEAVKSRQKTGNAFMPPDSFAGNYQTPGFQRGKKNADSATRNNWGRRSGSAITEHKTGVKRGETRSLMLEGKLIDAKTVKQPQSAHQLHEGDRIFHLKFGNGTIIAAEGDKLTIEFDKAGEKRVLANFVEKL